MTIPATTIQLTKTWVSVTQPLPYGTPTTTTYTGTNLRKNVSLTAKNSALMAKRRQGIAVFLPPLPYTFELSVFDILWGWRQTLPQGSLPGSYRSGFIQSGPPAAPVSSQDLTDADEIAYRRILSNLKNSNVNFAQFFAEGKQTAELLVKTATSVASALKKTKKGNIVGALKALGWGSNNRIRKKAAQAIVRDGKVIARSLGSEYLGQNASAAAKKASGNWLAMQFGWLPLLSDLDGAAKLMADRATQDPKRTRFHVKTNFKQDVANRNFRTYASNRYRDTVYTGYYSIFYRVDFFFKNAALASVSADGLTNPLSLSWELVPFSFISDYFVGVGGWLENLDSSFGKEFIGGSVTWAQKWTSKLDIYYDYKTPTTGYEKNQSKYVKVQRRVLTAFPDPAWATIAIKNPLRSKRRIANCLAVLAQAVDDFKR